MSESALDPIRQRDRPPAGLPNGSGSTGAEDRLANVIEDSEPNYGLSNACGPPFICPLPPPPDSVESIIMRLPLLFIFAALIASAQQPAPKFRATVKPGATSVSIAIPIRRAPVDGDTIQFQAPTLLLKATILTPDGRRITAENAEAAGFQWSETPITPPIGSADDGYLGTLFLRKTAPAGTYTIEFRSQNPATKSAVVSAAFVRDRPPVTGSALRDSKKLGRVTVTAPTSVRELRFTVARDQGGTMIDILVTHASARIRLTLPSGEVLTSESPARAGFEWKATGNLSDFDEDGFSVRPFLLAGPGMHHVIAVENPAPGAYVVRIERSASSPREISAQGVMVPVEQIFKEATDTLINPPGVRVASDTPQDCFVGEEIPLLVRLIGDPIAPNVKFEVRVETRPPLGRDARGSFQYGEPTLTTVPVAFTRSPNGLDRAVLIAKDSGLTRISIRASGTRTGGGPFDAETTVGPFLVSPVVAAFASLTEHAVDDDGNGRPDRLEIVASFDVIKPGKYEMRLTLEGSPRETVSTIAKAELAAGRGQIIASIPAKELFDRLKDGPYKIKNVQIFRPQGNTFGDFVQGRIPVLTTAAYKRDQWDRGNSYGQEKVELKPLRPVGSGKFTALEVVWEAIVPGGHCSWSGSLTLGRSRGEAVQSGDLAAGAQRFSFEFDARQFAAAQTSKGSVSVTVSCGRDPASFDTFLTVDPSQFAPLETPVRAFSRHMLNIRPGDSAFLSTAHLEAEGRAPGSYTFRVTKAPPQIAARIQGNAVVATMLEGTQPGRYYIEFEAASANDRDIGFVVVDVPPPLPVLPPRKYSAAEPSIAFVRPTADGKFRNIEMRWPVEIPGGECSWSASLRRGQIAAASGFFGKLPVGKITLIISLDSGQVGNSSFSDWILRGHVSCQGVVREPGVDTEMKLTLQPEQFAPRPGLRLDSFNAIRVQSDKSEATNLELRTTKSGEARFEVLNPPPGFNVRFMPAIQGDRNSPVYIRVQPWEVKPGRYFIPVRVTLNGEEGTAEVVVDVIPEH